MAEVDYIPASNGDGEAVRAIVTTTRGVGNMDLITDSVLNWPNKFVATSGMLDTVTGLLDPDTISVFKGHLTGSIITIEEFAPGYSDVGHAINESVVLKPSTFWADTVAAAVGAGGASVTIADTPPADPAEGDLWGDTNGSNYLTDIAKSVGNMLLPIGSIYTAVVSTNPTTLLGFGTWVAFGTGRTIVGVDTGQTEFDTIEETGGYKTTRHTFMDSPMNTNRGQWAGTNYKNSVTPDMNTYLTGGGSSSVTRYVNVRNVGGDIGTESTIGTEVGYFTYTAPNLQPYITVYMWKRTA